jgi:hypothetical protein
MVTLKVFLEISVQSQRCLSHTGHVAASELENSPEFFWCLCCLMKLIKFTGILYMPQDKNITQMHKMGIVHHVSCRLHITGHPSCISSPFITRVVTGCHYAGATNSWSFSRKKRTLRECRKLLVQYKPLQHSTSKQPRVIARADQFLDKTKYPCWMQMESNQWNKSLCRKRESKGYDQWLCIIQHYCAYYMVDIIPSPRTFEHYCFFWLIQLNTPLC